MLKRSFKHHKNSEIACYPHNWLILKKMISFRNAASSHSGLIPLKTAYKKRGELLWAIARSSDIFPGCNKLARCEKLKLCVTSQRAILGDLLYLLINEKFYKVSFLSQILAMVIFCFPPISMKGTASNICETSVYRAL